MLILEILCYSLALFDPKLSRNTKTLLSFYCQEYNCKIPVDPVTAMAFLSPAQFHAHYRRSRDTTLASSTKWHRCPNPHCGRIALVQLSQSDFVSHNGEAVAVRCGCGWLWCTQCKEPAHWPASCKQAETYRPLVKKRGMWPFPHLYSSHCLEMFV